MQLGNYPNCNSDNPVFLVDNNVFNLGTDIERIFWNFRRFVNTGLESYFCSCKTEADAYSKKIEDLKKFLSGNKVYITMEVLDELSEYKSKIKKMLANAEEMKSSCEPKLCDEFYSRMREIKKSIEKVSGYFENSRRILTNLDSDLESVDEDLVVNAIAVSGEDSARVVLLSRDHHIEDILDRYIEEGLEKHCRGHQKKVMITKRENVKVVPFDEFGVLYEIAPTN